MKPRLLSCEALETRKLLAADPLVADDLQLASIQPSAYYSRAIPSLSAATRVIEPVGAARDTTPNNGGFQIEIVPGLQLRNNPSAMAAARRAADQWEAVFFDPITVTIQVDLLSAPRQSLDGVLGLAAPIEVELPYSEVRAALQFDGLVEGDDDIVARLPDANSIEFAYPAGLSAGENIALSTANAKALGLYTQAINDVVGESDGRILLNQFRSLQDANVTTDPIHFDFNRNDGIERGDFDFESIVVHEIGHILGFISAVDRIDSAPATTQTISPSTLDLFRFRSLVGPDNPRTPAAFESIRRELRPSTPAVLDFVLENGWTDIEREYPVELGIDAGLIEPGLLPEDDDTTEIRIDFGYQASHWQAEDLFGETIGVMNPVIGSQTISLISNVDVRAFDLIGYDALPPNIPASAPELVDDQAVVDGTDRIVIDVLANDQNNAEPLDLSSFRIVEPAFLGTTTFDPVTGLLVYQPEQATANDIDIFTYTIADSRGLFARPAVVEIAITGQGVAPVAIDDIVLTRVGEPVAFNPLANDFDADNDLSLDDLSFVSGLQSGVVIRNGDSLTYTPDAGFEGTEQLTYLIEDSRGNTASATVDIIVGARLDPVVIPGEPLTLMQRADTNGDSRLSPGDALLTINYLSQPTGNEADVQKLDVSRDGIVSPLDVLLVLNLLSQQYIEAEPELLLYDFINDDEDENERVVHHQRMNSAPITKP